MFSFPSTNNQLISRAVDKYDESIASSKRNTSIGIALSVILLIGAVFLTLAARQILPYGINSISNLGLGGDILSYGLLALGAILTLVFAVKRYQAEKKSKQTVDDYLQSAKNQDAFDKKVQELSNAAVLTYSSGEGHEKLSDTFSYLTTLEDSKEHADKMHDLALKIAESAYAAKKYVLVAENIEAASRYQKLDEKYFTLWMLALIQQNALGKLEDKLSELEDLFSQQLYQFLLNNHAIYEERSSVATLAAYLGEKDFQAKRYDQAIKYFELANQIGSLEPTHRALMGCCYFKESYPIEKIEACLSDIAIGRVKNKYHPDLAEVYFYLANTYCESQKSRSKIWSAVSKVVWGTSSLSEEAQKSSNYYFLALSLSNKKLLHENFLSYISALQELPESEFNQLQEKCYELGRKAFKNEQWNLAAYYFLSATPESKQKKKSQQLQDAMTAFTEAMMKLEKDEMYGELLTKAIEIFEISPVEIKDFKFQGKWGKEKIYDSQDIKVKGRLHLLRAEFYELKKEPEEMILNEYILATRWAPKNPLGHEELIDSQAAKSTTRELIENYKQFAHLWNA